MRPRATGGQAVADPFRFSDGGHLTSYRTGGATHLIDDDARDRMARLRSGPPGAPALDLTYGYNRLSLATSILDSRGGVNQTHTYGYDALGRLTAVNGPSGARTLSYDAAGNRTGYTDPTGSYTYTYDPATNRLTWSSATNESFTYDATGAMTTDGAGIYEWKPMGLLAHVAGPGPTGLANYTYDGLGQRVNRYSYGSNMWHVWFRAPGGAVLSEYDVNGNTGVWTWMRDNLYIGSRLIGAVKGPSGQLEYYGKDVVDSVRVTFNADGSVFGRSDYAPFGADQSLTGGVPPYRFTSQRREDINDLDYFNARFYRPRLGRFHSADPLFDSGALKNPQRWNRYAYALNNPLTLSDPSGLTVRGRGPGGRSDCFVTSYDHWWCPGDNGQGMDNGGTPGDRGEYERGPGGGGGGGDDDGDGDGEGEDDGGGQQPPNTKKEPVCDVKNETLVAFGGVSGGFAIGPGWNTEGPGWNISGGAYSSSKNAGFYVSPERLKGRFVGGGVEFGIIRGLKNFRGPINTTQIGLNNIGVTLYWQQGPDGQSSWSDIVGVSGGTVGVSLGYARGAATTYTYSTRGSVLCRE